MKSNLIKEAVADAKAVRQTALANAKAALEEAFESRLGELLSPQLDEETKDFQNNDLGIEDTPPTDDLNIPDENEADETGVGTDTKVGEDDIADIIAELEGQLSQDATQNPDPTSPVEPMSPQQPAPVAPVPAPAPAPSPESAPMQTTAPETAPVAPAPSEPPPVSPQTDDQMDEEINLEELLESLKDEEEEECPEEANKCLEEGAPVDTSQIAKSDNKEPSSDASTSSDIGPSRQSVNSATVGTPDYVKKSSDQNATVKRPNQSKAATKDNLNITGGGLKEVKETGVPGGKVTAKEPTEAGRPNCGPVDEENMSTPALRAENVQLKTQLQEAEQTLTYLRGQLNEINLLNAKLLYTNKLFKGYSMDNTKKMKIVEMFDLAKNVREVKMTYAVIAESLNFGADFKKRIPNKIQNITEGMASRPVSGTAPSKKIITESAKSEMVAKFQKLAGIKAS